MASVSKFAPIKFLKILVVIPSLVSILSRCSIAYELCMVCSEMFSCFGVPLTLTYGFGLQCGKHCHLYWMFLSSRITDRLSMSVLSLIKVLRSMKVYFRDTSFTVCTCTSLRCNSVGGCALYSPKTSYTVSRTSADVRQYDLHEICPIFSYLF